MARFSHFLLHWFLTLIPRGPSPDSHPTLQLDMSHSCLGEKAVSGGQRDRHHTFSLSLPSSPADVKVDSRLAGKHRRFWGSLLDTWSVPLSPDSKRDPLTPPSAKAPIHIPSRDRPPSSTTAWLSREETQSTSQTGLAESYNQDTQPSTSSEQLPFLL